MASNFFPQVKAPSPFLRGKEYRRQRDLSQQQFDMNAQQQQLEIRQKMEELDDYLANRKTRRAKSKVERRTAEEMLEQGLPEQQVSTQKTQLEQKQTEALDRIDNTVAERAAQHIAEVDNNKDYQATLKYFKNRYDGFDPKNLGLPNKYDQEKVNQAVTTMRRNMDQRRSLELLKQKAALSAASTSQKLPRGYNIPKLQADDNAVIMAEDKLRDIIPDPEERSKVARMIAERAWQSYHMSSAYGQRVPLEALIDQEIAQDAREGRLDPFRGSGGERFLEERGFSEDRYQERRGGPPSVMDNITSPVDSMQYYYRQAVEGLGGSPEERTEEIARPQTKSEYDKLPKGAKYVHPRTGETKVKQ